MVTTQVRNFKVYVKNPLYFLCKPMNKLFRATSSGRERERGVQQVSLLHC